MSRVNDLIDSWGADITCDTPRDAQRMQQIVALARELEAEVGWLTMENEQLTLDGEQEES